MNTCGECKHFKFKGITYKNGGIRTQHCCEREPDHEVNYTTPACHFFQFKEVQPPPKELEELPF